MLPDPPRSLEEAPSGYGPGNRLNPRHAAHLMRWRAAPNVFALHATVYSVHPFERHVRHHPVLSGVCSRISRSAPPCRITNRTVSFSNVTSGPLGWDMTPPTTGLTR